MPSPRSYRVLIVDDQEDHLRTLKDHLLGAFDADPNLFGGGMPKIETESDA